MARTNRQTPPTAPHAPPSSGPVDVPNQAAPAYSSSEAEAVYVDIMDEQGAVVLPALPTSPPFILAVHPSKWTVQRGKVYPIASLHSLEPGVDNVGLVNNKVNWRPLMAGLNGRGYTVIPHRLGPNGNSYCTHVRVPGGRAHLSCFEKAYPNRNTTAIDIDAYIDWLLSLVSAGHIPQPPLITLEDLRDKTSRKMHTIAAKAQQRVELRATVDELHANIAAIDAKIAELTASLPAVSAESVDLSDDL